MREGAALVKLCRRRACRQGVRLEQQREPGCWIAIGLYSGKHANVAHAAIAQKLHEHGCDVAHGVGWKKRAAKTLGIARFEYAR